MSPRKRSGRVLRRLLWGGLGLWALALAVFWLTRPATAAPEPGEQVLSAATMGRSVNGGRLALLPRDSAVVVLAATSECAACRVGVPAYREIAARLKEEGVAFRVVVGSDSLPARQFSRLLPDPGAVVWDPRQKLLRSLGIRSVPTLYVVGPSGRLQKRWAPLPSDPRVAELVVDAAHAAR